MRMRTSIGLLSVWALAIIVVACGGSSKSNTPDAFQPDAFESDCGKPGEVGNEKGIGKFCASLSDCSTTPEAPLCSSLGDIHTHFCTKTCSATGSADQCGSVTMCACNTSNQCGCTPTACLGP
jgi:hypothetical protein